MDGRQHLEAVLGKRGGVAAAAKAWGIPYPSLYAVANGWRGVSRRQAAKWAAASNGELDAGLLVWIRATKRERVKEKAA